MRSFQREKSPFLAVKSLLKPVRKTVGRNTGDWRQVKDNLKPRTSPLSLQHLNKLKVHRS